MLKPVYRAPITHRLEVGAEGLRRRFRGRFGRMTTVPGGGQMA